MKHKKKINSGGGFMKMFVCGISSKVDAVDRDRVKS